MPLKNMSERFGLIAKSFHWVMAVFILGLLTVGYVMAGLAVSPDKIKLVYLHKSFGILVLMLAVGRLAWRYVSPRPARDPRIKPWEDRLATIVHGLLYVVLFAMPLSGWIMSSAGDYPASFFGLFTLPEIVPKNAALMMTAGNIHSALAVIILVLLALHFAGAAKHHVIDGDDTLRRMTFQNLGRVGGVVLLGVLGVLYLVPVSVFVFGDDEEESGTVSNPAIESTAQPAEINDTAWTVLPESSIKFQALQYGQPFEGEFKNFEARIVFDPANLPASKAEIAIPISGISTGDANRDGQARSVDWFDEAQFPRAVFSTTAIEPAGVPGHYLARGRLGLRGVEKDIDLPFTLAITDENGVRTAVMDAELSLNRFDFGVGQNQWAKADIIAGPVNIVIHVKAALHPPESGK